MLERLEKVLHKARVTALERLLWDAIRLSQQDVATAQSEVELQLKSCDGLGINPPKDIQSALYACVIMVTRGIAPKGSIG